jgi:hypothetical protein
MTWIIRDRRGNNIVLTEERWQHIIQGHWELKGLLDVVLETVRMGTRRQDAADPDKFRYSRRVRNLPHGYTHIIVIVRFKPNKFVVTAYPKRVRWNMDNQLSFLYDREADVLYVSKGHLDYTDYQEVGNLILRLDPRTKEIVGFTIVDFEGRFAREQAPLTIPLKATFERSKSRKLRAAAEKKTAYRVKRNGTKSTSGSGKGERGHQSDQ